MDAVAEEKVAVTAEVPHRENEPTEGERSSSSPSLSWLSGLDWRKQEAQTLGVEVGDTSFFQKRLTS